MLPWPLSVFESKLDAIIASQKQEQKSMSAISDAVAKVAADVAQNAKDVQAVLAILNQPNPDVAAAVTALEGVASNLEGTNKTLEAAAPPAA
jgi:hypothetical protein